MNAKWVISTDCTIYVNEPSANTRRKMGVITCISHTTKYKQWTNKKQVALFTFLSCEMRLGGGFCRVLPDVFDLPLPPNMVLPFGILSIGDNMGNMRVYGWATYCDWATASLITIPSRYFFRSCLRTCKFLLFCVSSSRIRYLWSHLEPRNCGGVTLLCRHLPAWVLDRNYRHYAFRCHINTLLPPQREKVVN